MATNKSELKMLWALACTSSSVDQASNNVSLFGVLEQVQFKIDDPVAVQNSIPAEGAFVPFPFDIIATIARTGSKEEKLEVTGKIAITDPNERVILEAPMRSVMEAGKGRLRLTLKFDAFKVTTSGNYYVRLFLKEGEAFSLGSEIPIEVSVEIVSNQS